MRKIKISALDRFLSKIKINKKTKCWEIEPFLNKRYPEINIDNRMIKTHRFSYEYYIGKIPSGMYCLHKCDNTKCCNPEHLFIGNQSDNMKDMVSKNRHSYPIGEKAFNAKLTEKQVLQIKAKYLKGFTTIQLAKQYNVHDTTINRLLIGKSWRNSDNRIKQCRGVSKINEAIRLKIFKDFKDGNKRSVISRKYNVSWTTINRVLIHGNQIS